MQHHEAKNNNNDEREVQRLEQSQHSKRKPVKASSLLPKHNNYSFWPSYLSVTNSQSPLGICLEFIY